MPSNVLSGDGHLWSGHDRAAEPSTLAYRPTRAAKSSKSLRPLALFLAENPPQIMYFCMPGQRVGRRPVADPGRGSEHPARGGRRGRGPAPPFRPPRGICRNTGRPTGFWPGGQMSIMSGRRGPGGRRTRAGSRASSGGRPGELAALFESFLSSASAKETYRAAQRCSSSPPCWVQLPSSPAAATVRARKNRPAT